MSGIHIPQGYSVGIKLKTPSSEIQKNTLLGLRDALNQAMPSLAKYIKEDLTKQIDTVFLSSTEYYLLVNGRGRGDLGIPAGEEVDRLAKIIEKLSQQVIIETVKFTVANNTFRSGGLNIFIFKSNFQEIIDLPESHVITEKGEDIPWLEWFLLGGNKILISGYDVKLGKYGTRSNKQGMVVSRSGIAIMVPEGSFSLPYAGTQNDNWITRAIDVSIAIGYMQEIIDSSIKKWLTRFGQ